MTPTGHKDYSATPLPRKLGVREGSRILIVGEPAGFSLGPVPAGTAFARSARGTLDVVLVFTRTLADLRRRFPVLARTVDPAGRLWVAWPKKAADVATDLTFEAVQRVGLDQGLVDNKSASIDEVYQGLQFVFRLKDRPQRAAERAS
ncbi:MAG: DUF3052 domain-containing protein [Actinomycetota bacterium]